MRVDAALAAQLPQLRPRPTYELGPGVTVVTGRNGAGKTNLLDALYFGCTGRSCRTTNERELVRFGEAADAAGGRAEDADGPHELSVGFQPGEPKRLRSTACRSSGCWTSPAARS